MSSLSEDSYGVSDSSSSNNNQKKFKRYTLESNSKKKADANKKLSTKDEFFKTEFKKAQDELMDTKNMLYDLQFNLDTKITELSESKRENNALKKKMKNYKIYKEKAKQYKHKLKEASRDIQTLEVKHKTLLDTYRQEFELYTQNVGIVMNRDRVRRAKFQVKSITHSINKMLKINMIDPLISRELNLMLDCWGKLMGDLHNEPFQNSDNQIQETDCNSMSSRAIESMGMKALQKYKEIWENDGRPESHAQTQYEVDPQNYNEDRISKVKTSQSQKYPRSCLKSPIESEEDRIRIINKDLLANSKEIDTQDLVVQTDRELVDENMYLKNEIAIISNQYLPKYERVISDLQNQNEKFQRRIMQLEQSNAWDDTSEKMLQEIQKMQESIDAVKYENKNLKDQKEIFQNQLITLRNVNESQQKLINFLNNSTSNDNRSSPSFFYDIHYRGIDTPQDFSAIEENEKDNDESFSHNHYLDHIHNYENESQTFKEQDQSNNKQSDNQVEVETEEVKQEEPMYYQPTGNMYSDIIGSFQSVHNKIMEFNKHRVSRDSMEHGKIYKNTAKFDEPADEKFLYEFEKAESDHDHHAFNTNQNESSEYEIHPDYKFSNDYKNQKSESKYEYSYDYKSNQSFNQNSSKNKSGSNFDPSQFTAGFDKENTNNNVNASHAMSLIHSFDKAADA